MTDKASLGKHALRLDLLEKELSSLSPSASALTNDISPLLQLPPQLLGIYGVIRNLDEILPKIEQLASKDLRTHIGNLRNWVVSLETIEGNLLNKSDLNLLGAEIVNGSVKPLLRGLYTKYPVWCALWFMHGSGNLDYSEIYSWLQAQYLLAYINITVHQIELPSKRRPYEAGFLLRNLHHNDFNTTLKKFKTVTRSPEKLQDKLVELRDTTDDASLSQGYGAFAEMLGHAHGLEKQRIFHGSGNRGIRNPKEPVERFDPNLLFKDHAGYWFYVNLATLNIDGDPPRPLIHVNSPTNTIKNELSPLGVDEHEFDAADEISIRLEELYQDDEIEELPPLGSLYAAARARARHVAMDAQRFTLRPQRIRRGTIREIVDVLQREFNDAQTVKPGYTKKRLNHLHDMIVHAAISLATGTSPDVTKQIVIVSELSELPDEYSLAYNSEKMMWIRLAKGVARNELSLEQTTHTIETESHVMFYDILGAGRFLKYANYDTLARIRRNSPYHYKLWDEAIKPKLHDAGVDPRWCEWSTLGEILPSWFSGLEEGDHLSSAMLFGRDDPFASTHGFYTTYSRDQLVVRHAEVINALWTSLSLPDYTRLAARLFEFQHNHVPIKKSWVGDDRIVRGESIIALIKTLQESITTASSAIDLSAQALYHNLLTLYTALGLAIATGFRTVRTPITDLTAIHRPTGTLSLQEKDRKDCSHARLAILPKAVIQQIDIYLGHLRELYLSLPFDWLMELTATATKHRDRSRYNSDTYTLDLKRTLFFMEYSQEKGWYPVELTGARLQAACDDVLPNHWPVANVGRHFLRSYLTYKACPVTIINTLLGHWHYGEESWGPASSFDPVIYRQQLSPYLDGLFTALKFKTVS